MTTSPTPRTPSDPYRRVWLVLALLIPATVLGFANSYLQGLTFSGLTFTTLVHLHGGLMALWVVMLAAQAWLVRSRRMGLHRRVGRASYVVVPLSLLTMILLSHETLARDPELTLLDFRFQIFNVMQFVGFGLSWALALVYRHRMALHARFMVATFFATASAIVARILINWFAWVPGLSLAADPDNIENVIATNGALILLVLVALIAVDWRLGIKRSPFWLVTTTTLTLHVGFFTFTKSAGWRNLVEWFAGLPL
jgi:hypothetical protein